MKELGQNKDIYLRGRRAYVAFLRAYARLKDKTIFNAKKLNLRRLVEI